MPSVEPPVVTVVIPTLDRWSFLSTRSLPSALSQEGVAFEVIVVDDGSSDQTQAGLAEITDARLRVIRHERPRGVAFARNAGIRAARGEWVAFLDDDDLWAPEKLRLQVGGACAAGASFVYSDIVVRHLRRGVLYELCAPAPDDLDTKLLERYAIPGGASNIVAETELVQRLGGFDEELSFSADWDFWLRLARAGKGVRCAGVLAATTAHSENMPVRTRWPELMQDVDRFIAKHEPDGLSIDRAGLERWFALQRVSDGRRLEPATRLVAIAIHHRRPRYVLQAVRLLVPRRRRAPDEPSVEAPAWLVALEEPRQGV